MLLGVVYLDGAALYGHEIGAKDHLTEAIVVHTLKAGLFLGAIHIYSLVFSIDLTVDLSP